MILKQSFVIDIDVSVSINKHHKLKSYLHRPAGFMIQVEDGFLRNSSTNKL